MGIGWSRLRATSHAEAHERRAGQEGLSPAPASTLFGVATTGKSASGITRKRASASRSPKPPAKTVRKTPRSARSASKGRFKSGWEKNVADRWAIHARVFEGLPWSEIVERDGRSERALRAVVSDYLEHVQEGDAVRPLERDPIELVESLLNELTILQDTMVGLVNTSEDARVIVAATREWRRLMKEARELLQAVGKLPRDLSVMGHLVEVRELSDTLDGVLDQLEAGTITPQQVRARVAEWACVESVSEGAASAV